MHQRRAVNFTSLRTCVCVSVRRVQNLVAIIWYVHANAPRTFEAKWNQQYVAMTSQFVCPYSNKHSIGKRHATRATKVLHGWDRNSSGGFSTMLKLSGWSKLPSDRQSSKLQWADLRLLNASWTNSTMQQLLLALIIPAKSAVCSIGYITAKINVCQICCMPNLLNFCNL